MKRWIKPLAEEQGWQVTERDGKHFGGSSITDQKELTEVGGVMQLWTDLQEARTNLSDMERRLAEMSASVVAP